SYSGRSSSHSGGGYGSHRPLSPARMRRGSERSEELLQRRQLEEQRLKQQGLVGVPLQGLGRGGDGVDGGQAAGGRPSAVDKGVAVRLLKRGQPEPKLVHAQAAQLAAVLLVDLLLVDAVAITTGAFLECFELGPVAGVQRFHACAADERRQFGSGDGDGCAGAVEA